MKGIILLIIAILLVLVALVVGFRNSELITINYLIAQVNMRLSTFMVICLIVGFFLGFITILAKYFTMKIRFANMKRQLDKLSNSKTS